MNISQGRATVTTPATAVALGGDTHCSRLIIVAETNNTNPVTVGGANVVGALLTREGVPLAPGSGLESRLELFDVKLNQVFIDAITATEGVTYTIIN